LCPRCLLAADSATRKSTNPSRPSAPPPLAEVARHFPQLEIVELLGQGGMGVVYKARQPHLDRLVALKILPAESGRDATFAERFVREARALAKLNHPGIVAIYDFGNAGPYFYFIMEFVDGVNLRQMIEGRQMSPREALKLVMQICEALQFAHDQGVVHRDIKPGNILVDRAGRAKIADFGLAKLLDPGARDFTLTGAHQVMGTPHYMAPEQMSRPQEVDHRADIYSLGVVFYEMLTGDLPVGRFALPSQKLHVDVRLDEVVLRTLEQEPRRRYQHVSEVRSEVEKISTTTGAAALPTGAAAPLGTTPLPPGMGPQVGLASGGMVVGALIILAGIAAVIFAFATQQFGSGAFWGIAGGGLGGILGGGGALLGSWNSYRQLQGRADLMREPHWNLVDHGALLLTTLGISSLLLGFVLGPGIGGSTAYVLKLLGGMLTFQGALLLAIRAPIRHAAREVRSAAGEASPRRPGRGRLLVVPFLFVLVVAGIGMFLRPRADLTIIRERPPSFGHLSRDGRWCDYAVVAPVNHRVSFRLEWWKDGQRVNRPDFTLVDSFTPARGRAFKGSADLVIWRHNPTLHVATNIVQWQWAFMGGDAFSDASRLAEDPFLGLSLTDSSFGHEPVRRVKSGEEIDLLVVRGDRERLEGHPWDPKVAGRADVEMRLKARIDAVPDSELREGPQSSSTFPPPTPLPSEGRTTH
jgi:predicted Ser/Thr protein kinase